MFSRWRKTESRSRKTGRRCKSNSAKWYDLKILIDAKFRLVLNTVPYQPRSTQELEELGQNKQVN